MFDSFFRLTRERHFILEWKPHQPVIFCLLKAQSFWLLTWLFHFSTNTLDPGNLPNPGWVADCLSFPSFGVVFRYLDRSFSRRVSCGRVDGYDYTKNTNMSLICSVIEVPANLSFPVLRASQNYHLFVWWRHAILLSAENGPKVNLRAKQTNGIAQFVCSDCRFRLQRLIDGAKRTYFWVQHEIWEKFSSDFEVDHSSCFLVRRTGTLVDSLLNAEDGWLGVLSNRLKRSRLGLRRIFVRMVCSNLLSLSKPFDEMKRN